MTLIRPEPHIDADSFSTDHRCPIFLARRHIRTREVRIHHVDCLSKRCLICAPRLAREWIEDAGPIFERYDELWVSESPPDDDMGVRLRQRRRRTSSQSVQARREDSEYVFATADLSGRLAPTEGVYMPAQDALDLFASAVRLPGLRRAPVWSRGWQPSRDPRIPREWEMLARGNEDLFMLAFDEAVRQAELQYGVAVEMGGAWPASLPHEVFDGWIEGRMRFASDDR